MTVQTGRVVRDTNVDTERLLLIKRYKTEQQDTTMLPLTDTTMSQLSDSTMSQLVDYTM